MVDNLGELANSPGSVGSPIRDVRLLPGGLANDAKAQRVKRGGFHRDAFHAQPLKGFGGALLEFICCLLVEGE
ncbi:hypothetical protein D9M68_995520 [compost metagenome]